MASEYPPENIEPDIERRLTIARITIPPKETWKGYISPSELEALTTSSPVEQKLILLVSMIEQQVDLILNAMQLQNSQMRQLEAAQIRSEMERGREAERDRGMQSLWRFLKWAGLLLGAAAIAFFAKKFLPQLFP